MPARPAPKETFLLQATERRLKRVRPHFCPQINVRSIARKTLTVASLALILTACAATEDLKQAPSSRFIQTKPDAGPVAAKPQPTATRETEKRQQASLAPERNFPEPSILTDLSADKVTSLLGAPGFKRQDDPAEIWQYRAENCIMDLYLYESLENVGRSVAHYEMRFQAGKKMTEQTCFVSVIKAAENAVKTS